MVEQPLEICKLCEVVDQSNPRAYALYCLGIKFYEYSDKTVGQVCLEKGLNIAYVVQTLKACDTELLQAEKIPLASYPIDLIIDYLTHAHLTFLKYKFPYIARLIESFHSTSKKYETIERDLKTLFPLFMEDFILHVHDEEDMLFQYILTLDKAAREKTPLAKVYYLMETHSLQHYAIEHEVHDDEMRGIRDLTNNYAFQEDMPLHMRVLYNELLTLEKNLKQHAKIENEILFPKAIMIEHNVRQLFDTKTKLN